MSQINEISMKLKALSKEIAPLAIDTLKDEDIAILQDRLEQGKRADGSDFPEYSPATIGYKQSSGGFISPSGNIALKDSGDFYNSMEWLKKTSFAEIDGNDEHNLFANYGDDILDLSEDEATEIMEQRRDDIINNIKTYLGL